MVWIPGGAFRMGSDDFTWVAQAIAIHREVGGNLAEVLDAVGGDGGHHRVDAAHEVGPAGGRVGVGGLPERRQRDGAFPPSAATRPGRIRPIEGNSAPSGTC
jgi:hypothetical protein